MLHHYTHATTLPLMLSSRAIRFTRADLLDDPSEVPHQTTFLEPRKFFVSSWSQGTHGESGMWARYGDYDRGVRLSVDDLVFPWAPLSIDISRETGGYKADGTPERVGLRCRNVATPYDRATSLGDGYVAIPMGGNLRVSFGGRVLYAADPEGEAKRMVTCTAGKMSVGDDATHLARIKGMAWADQAEYRFVISAVKGPRLNYASDPLAYEDALVSLVKSGLSTGFADFYLEVRYIDLPLAPSAFDGLVVTLGPAMPTEQRDLITQQVKACVPAARVQDSALRVRPRS